MKLVKHLLSLVTIPLTGTVAHAEMAAATATGGTSSHSSDPASMLPLGLFVVSAIIVYLCNRPRGVVVYARARRRTNASRPNGR